MSDFTDREKAGRAICIVAAVSAMFFGLLSYSSESYAGIVKGISFAFLFLGMYLNPIYFSGNKHRNQSNGGILNTKNRKSLYCFIVAICLSLILALIE